MAEAPDQFYTGLVADLYGPLRSETPEPAPYAAFVRRFGQPALELGCGDGDPMLDLVADGLVVEGLDSSADMLDRCRRAAAARGLDVTLHHQTMEAMELATTYRSIYLAGATFTLLPDDAAAERALRRIAAHLHVDGAALIPLFIPEPTAETVLGRPREHVATDGSVLRFTVVGERRDESQRQQRAQVRYERLDGGVVRDSAHREWLLHWHTRDGFTAMAERCGLAVRSVIDIGGAGSNVFSFVLTHP
ncbi:MAG: class I SAM-dependent methyltransferase [Ilumatobacteraceae bacterium]